MLFVFTFDLYPNIGLLCLGVCMCMHAHTHVHMYVHTYITDTLFMCVCTYIGGSKEGDGRIVAL